MRKKGAGEEEKEVEENETGVLLMCNESPSPGEPPEGWAEMRSGGGGGKEGEGEEEEERKCESKCTEGTGSSAVVC